MSRSLGAFANQLRSFVSYVPASTSLGWYLNDTVTVRFRLPALPGQSDGPPGLNTRTAFSVPSLLCSSERPCMYESPDGVSKKPPQIVGPLGSDPPPPLPPPPPPPPPPPMG